MVFQRILQYQQFSAHENELYTTFNFKGEWKLLEKVNQFLK